MYEQETKHRFEKTKSSFYSTTSICGCLKFQMNECRPDGRKQIHVYDV